MKTFKEFTESQGAPIGKGGIFSKFNDSDIGRLRLNVKKAVSYLKVVRDHPPEGWDAKFTKDIDQVIKALEISDRVVLKRL